MIDSALPGRSVEPIITTAVIKAVEETLVEQNGKPMTIQEAADYLRVSGRVNWVYSLLERTDLTLPRWLLPAYRALRQCLFGAFGDVPEEARDRMSPEDHEELERLIGELVSNTGNQTSRGAPGCQRHTRYRL